MSLQQVSGSTFASIVKIPSYMKPWPIVDGDQPLALLHAKFWGKSMADEEQEWLNAQLADPAMGSELGLGDQEGEERMYDSNVVDERMVMDETVVVDETMDEATTTDPDDDIIPGCYMLDIGIDGIQFSKIWIRAEYIRIFNSLNAYYNTPVFQPRAPAAIITGQPGIGKSVWIYYALRRCLAERRPVIWYFKRCCYLFVEEGAHEMPADFQKAHFKSFVWTLVDSDEAMEGVPPDLVPHNTRLFVIFSSSPRGERWSRLHKTVRTIVIIMNPWKRKEIFRVASIYPLVRINESRTNEIFERLGPTPRLCLDYQLNSLEMSQYERNLDVAISEVTSDKLKSLLRTAASGDLRIDALSNKITLLSRESLDDVHSRAAVTPITPFIRSRLSNQFRNLAREDQLRLYEYFARVPEGRKMAGVFFEALARGELQEGITLELVPMVKLDEPRKGALPRWYSSHELLNNPKLEAGRKEAWRRRFNIEVNPVRTEEFPDDGPLSLVHNVIYVPEADNHVALDSFIWLDDFFIFQFSIAQTHDIKPGRLDFFDRYAGIPPLSSWKFVSVVEPKQILTCPQPRNLVLRELGMYSAVVDVKKR